MSNFTIRVSGLDQVRAFLRQYGPRARLAYRRAIRGIGETIMTDAKEHYVPVKEGHLRDSGHVEGPVAAGDVDVLTLAFGGVTAPYADVQHENLEFHHTVGQAKFLEVPALRVVPGLAEELAARMRPELER